MINHEHALSIATKEISLSRYQKGLWVKACRIAELNHLSAKVVYGRLRVCQLMYGEQAANDSAIDSSEVIEGLRNRTRQMIWEGGMLINLLLVSVIGCMHIF